MSQQFWSSWAWPLATSVLGFVFTGLVLRQWVTRRKPHQAAWAVGLFFYAAAAFIEFWSSYTRSWNPDVYRVYIVLAASLVGFLGLGTLYLLVGSRRPWGHVYLAFNIACFVVFLAGAFAASLDVSKLQPGITVGGAPLGASLTFPRIMSFPFNIPGSIFLIGGALWSVWRFFRRREFAYRMWANVLIALGAILIAIVGSRARFGSTTGLYPAEMAASALLLAGFLLAGTLQRGRAAVREGRAAGTEDRAEDRSGLSSEGSSAADEYAGPGRISAAGVRVGSWPGHGRVTGRDDASRRSGAAGHGRMSRTEVSLRRTTSSVTEPINTCRTWL